MVSQEEAFILKILSEKGAMPFKELNEACADQFEGCRLILKKLKEQGFVSFDGMIPSFGATISFVKPDERESRARQARQEQAVAHGPVGDAARTVLAILEKHGGKMGYKTLNDLFSEKHEGLRLLLRKMKDAGQVDYEGDMPSFSSEIQARS